MSSSGTSRGEFIQRHYQIEFPFPGKTCSEKSERKIAKVCCRNRKRFAAPAAGLLFFLFVVSLIILIATDLANSLEGRKTVKVKRYVHSNAFAPPNNRLTTVSKPTDVRVFPLENSTNATQRGNSNPPKFTSFEMRTNKGQKGENEPSDLSKMIDDDNRTNVKASERSQLVKVKSGFTVEGPKVAELSASGRKNARNGQGDYRPDEINEIMQKDFDQNREDESKLEKKTFKNLGSPFRPSSKAPDYHPTHRKRSSNLWVKSNLIRNKKKPLTLLMDIYPMNHHDHIEEDNSIEGTDKKTFYKPNLPGNIIYIPIKSKNGLTESMISRLISSKDRQNRMLLKLNLYPSGKKYRGKGGLDTEDEDDDEGEEAYLEIMRPGRRNSPSLSKIKKFKVKFKSTRCCRDSSGRPLRKLRKVRRVYPVGKLVKTIRPV